MTPAAFVKHYFQKNVVSRDISCIRVSVSRVCQGEPSLFVIIRIYIEFRSISFRSIPNTDLSIIQIYIFIRQKIAKSSFLMNFGFPKVFTIRHFVLCGKRTILLTRCVLNPTPLLILSGLGSAVTFRTSRHVVKRSAHPVFPVIPRLSVFRYVKALIIHPNRLAVRDRL